MSRRPRLWWCLADHTRDGIRCARTIKAFPRGTRPVLMLLPGHVRRARFVSAFELAELYDLVRAAPRRVDLVPKYSA
jgi:hypothetical protein